MSLVIKICGLSTVEALDVALDAGVDMVGFVFFQPSPRHLSLEKAQKLGTRVRKPALKVALTVDADDRLLHSAIDAVHPDLLQLHGQETPDRVMAIKRRFGLPVMKAVAVESRDDLARVADYVAVADWLLFDARAPREATRPGGFGKPFDWHLLKDLDINSPYLLSGGLDPGNVGEALRITHAPGVDVSSGVEARGQKHPDKIRAFVRAARDAAERYRTSQMKSPS